MHPCDIPALVRELKSETSSYINQNKLSQFKFQWQGSYGLFTYSISHRSAVIRYIENQQKHHKRTFKEEYLEFLQKFEIEYDKRYLFDFFE